MRQRLEVLIIPNKTAIGIYLDAKISTNRNDTEIHLGPRVYSEPFQ